MHCVQRHHNPRTICIIAAQHHCVHCVRSLPPGGHADMPGICPDPFTHTPFFRKTGCRPMSSPSLWPKAIPASRDDARPVPWFPLFWLESRARPDLRGSRGASFARSSRRTWWALRFPRAWRPGLLELAARPGPRPYTGNCTTGVSSTSPPSTSAGGVFRAFVQRGRPCQISRSIQVCPNSTCGPTGLI